MAKKYIYGTDHDDVLAGTSGDDAIFGYDGDDLFRGSAGNDTFDGGRGWDTVDYSHASGAVKVDLQLGSGEDGQGGKDYYQSIEAVIGSAWNDRLYGDDRANSLDGGGGSDWLYGRGGDDTLIASVGNDRLDGGDGIDVVDYRHARSGVSVDLLFGSGDKGSDGTDTLSNVENVVGSSWNDRLSGDNNDNWLDGANGSDSLYGRGGNDVLSIDGNDRVADGGEGIDTLWFVDVDQEHAGTFCAILFDDGTGAASSQVMILPNAPPGLSGNGIVQLAGMENIYAMVNDAVHLYGNKFDNTLCGGWSNDTLNGGGGNDTLAGLDGADTFVFDHLGAANANQHDLIADFQPGVDHIDLTDTGVQDFHDLLTPGDRYMEQVGNDVLIHTSVAAHTDILLQNVHMSSLTQSDFLFLTN